MGNKNIMQSWLKTKITVLSMIKYYVGM